ncbi:MAG TPA: hypothetical protein VGD60_08085, partial [Candidatus Acidoferrales bacterium]
LGNAITTRAVQLLNYSPAFRDLVRDVFSGSQDYRSLKRRCWNQLGITLAEIMRTFLTPRRLRFSPAGVTDAGNGGESS